MFGFGVAWGPGVVGRGAGNSIGDAAEVAAGWRS
jgi:hypothetical protein